MQTLQCCKNYAKAFHCSPNTKAQCSQLLLTTASHCTNIAALSHISHRCNKVSPNLLYQSIIHTTEHKFRTSASFVYDKYNEDFKGKNYYRSEVVSGAFLEYTFTPSAKFDAVVGVREDYNSMYGWFTTPRLNIRYQPLKNTVISVSAGRGQRTANIFAENNRYLPLQEK